jgi:hypothetical protein
MDSSLSGPANQASALMPLLAAMMMAEGSLRCWVAVLHINQDFFAYIPEKV